MQHLWMPTAIKPNRRRRRRGKAGCACSRQKCHSFQVRVHTHAHFTLPYYHKVVSLLEVQWCISWKISTADPESVCVGRRARGACPRDSFLDQLLLAEPAANRAPGSSRWIWLALHGRRGSREGGSGYLCGGGKEEGRYKREALCVVDRQMSGCWAESGELHTCWPEVSIFPQSARHLASS